MLAGGHGTPAARPAGGSRATVDGPGALPGGGRGPLRCGAAVDRVEVVRRPGGGRARRRRAGRRHPGGRLRAGRPAAAAWRWSTSGDVPAPAARRATADPRRPAQRLGAEGRRRPRRPGDRARTGRIRAVVPAVGQHDHRPRARLRLRSELGELPAAPTADDRASRRRWSRAGHRPGRTRAVALDLRALAAGLRPVGRGRPSSGPPTTPGGRREGARGDPGARSNASHRPAGLGRPPGNPHANPNHVEMSIDQLLGVPALAQPVRLPDPDRGLFLTGAGTHPGGGVTGVPGRNTAAVVLDALGGTGGGTANRARRLRRRLAQVRDAARALRTLRGRRAPVSGPVDPLELATAYQRSAVVAAACASGRRRRDRRGAAPGRGGRRRLRHQPARDPGAARRPGRARPGRPRPGRVCPLGRRRPPGQRPPRVGRPDRGQGVVLLPGLGRPARERRRRPRPHRRRGATGWTPTPAARSTFLRALDDLAARFGGELPALAGLEGPGRLLDVGGGAGSHAAALAAAVPGLEATVLDLPAVEPVLRERHPELAFVPGDLDRPASAARRASAGTSSCWRTSSTTTRPAAARRSWPRPPACSRRAAPCWSTSGCSTTTATARPRWPCSR